MVTCTHGSATINARLLGRLRLCPKTVFAIGLLVIAFGLLDVWHGGLSPIFGQVTLGKGESMEILVPGVAALVGGTCIMRGRN